MMLGGERLESNAVTFERCRAGVDHERGSRLNGTRQYPPSGDRSEVQSTEIPLCGTLLAREQGPRALGVLSATASLPMVHRSYALIALVSFIAIVLASCDLPRDADDTLGRIR